MQGELNIIVGASVKSIVITKKISEIKFSYELFIKRFFPTRKKFSLNMLHVK